MYFHFIFKKHFNHKTQMTKQKQREKIQEKSEYRKFIFMMEVYQYLQQRSVNL